MDDNPQTTLAQEAAEARARAEIAAKIAEACRSYVYKLLDNGCSDWRRVQFEHEGGKFTLEVDYQP